MSILNKIKKLPHHLPTGTTERPGVKGFLVSKGELWGGALTLGIAKGYLGEKFLFMNHGIDLWLGVGLTLASTGLNAFSSGHSRLAPHLERLGDAGVMSALSSLGAAWGLEKAGRSVQVLKPGKNVKTLAGDVIGYIPAAKPGAYLSDDKIMNFAKMR